MSIQKRQLINNETGAAFVPIGHTEATYDANGKTVEQRLAEEKSARYGMDVYCIDGFIRADNGDLLVNDVCKATDFIMLDGVSAIKVTGSVAGSQAAIAFYDKDKTFISAINQAASVTIPNGSIPSGAVYARSSTYNTTLSTISLEMSSINGIGVALARLSGDVAGMAGEVSELSVKVKDIKDTSAALTESGYYGDTGYVVSSDYGRNTGKVAIDGYTRLTYKTKMPSAFVAVLFWDEDKALLPDLNIAGASGWAEGEIDLTDNDYEDARYFSVNYYDQTSQFAGFIGRLHNADSIETRLTEVEDSVTLLAGEVEDTKEKINGIKDNDMTLSESGYYRLDGTLNQSDNAKNTGKIPIEGYTKFTYAAKISNQGLAVAFWDVSQQFLSSISIPGGSGVISGTIDLTDNAYASVRYVTISYYDNTGMYADYIGRLYNEGSLESRIVALEESNPLCYTGKGLNVLIFGDSITDCATISIANDKTTAYTLNARSNAYVKDGQTIYYSMWPYLLTRYINCNDIRNYAKSGASYKDVTRSSGNERQNVSYQITVALNDLDNPNNVFPTVGDFVPDIVIFALGVNDGAPNDDYASAMAKTVMDGQNFDVAATLAALDRTKTFEGVRWAFMKVKQAFPYAITFCVLPLQLAEREQDVLGINNDLSKMAERYSIHVINGFADSGIVRDFERRSELGTLLKDGLHPNDKGQNLLARLVIANIRNYWIDESKMN